MKRRAIIKRARKTRKTRINKTREIKPKLIVIGIFILGLLVGGGIFSLFNPSKSQSTDNYYLDEAYTLPRGLVLGTNTKKFPIPILLYHYVEYNRDPKDTIRMGLTIRRDVFEKQVQDLLKLGYKFLTVSEIGEIIDGKAVMPNKAVALTFDDGYRDFYTDIFPILSFYDIHATLFIVSDFLNHSNNLTDAQLSEIVRSGLVEIGGHTVNHLALTSLTSEKAWQEIVEDKKYLENKFGIKMVSFAYPYGLFNEDVVQLVREAGYNQAVSVVKGSEQGSDNRFFMYRIRPGNAIGEYLEKLVGQE